MNIEATTEATADIIMAVLDEAVRVGMEERERLGRDLTEAEAANLAEMVDRQFKTALSVMREFPSLGMPRLMKEGPVGSNPPYGGKVVAHGGCCAKLRLVIDRHHTPPSSKFMVQRMLQDAQLNVTGWDTVLKTTDEAETLQFWNPRVYSFEKLTQEDLKQFTSRLERLAVVKSWIDDDAVLTGDMPSNTHRRYAQQFWFGEE